MEAKNAKTAKTQAPVLKKAVKAPEKTTMNLAPSDQVINWKVMGPVVIILIAAVLVFAKFGILDQLNKKTAAYNDLATKQATLSAYNVKLASASETEELYGRYSYGWLSEEEQAAVDRLEIISLIDSKVGKSAGIKNFAVSGNILTMNLTGITLQKASDIATALEEEAIVESATIYSATTSDEEDSNTADIFMSVTLVKEAEAE